VVVAMPTVPERADACAAAADAWRISTPARVDVVTSTVPGGWCAGLNDVWRRRRGADVFVCASDDMLPEDGDWLEPVLRQLRRGAMPVPCVIDPRWTNYGGFDEPVADGTPSPRCTFPILAGEWLDLVFPLPDDLHYFGDDLARDRIVHAGIPSVAVPSSRIRHLWDQRARGAGAGSEGARMEIDAPRYRRALATLGREPERRTAEPTFTVVVVTTGGCALHTTLDSLALQLTTRDEVLVAPLAEPSQAQTMCEELERSRWRCVHSPTPVAAAARSTAIAEATGDRLCLADDTVVYTPDAFATIRCACAEAPGRPQMFRIGGSTLRRGRVDLAMLVPLCDRSLLPAHVADDDAFVAAVLKLQGPPDRRPDVVAIRRS
jgi:hypothetical protein